MAPEQAHDPTKVDRRADIYAVGILLFEAVCGQRPFSGHTVGELIGAHLFQEAEKPSVVYQRKGLPARTIQWRQLDAVVHKALAKQANARFATCDSLRQQLALAWRDNALWVAASQSSLGISAPAGRPTQSLGLVLGALAALGAAGGALWFGTRPQRQPELAGKAVDQSPQERAAARLQAALHNGVAERRALVAALELVHNRALLPYVEATLSDQAAAVWPSAVPVVAAIGQVHDDGLRELLRKRAAQANTTVAVDIAAAALQLGDRGGVPILSAAAASNAVVPRLRATLALCGAGLVAATELARVLALSEQAGSVPPALRQDALVQLVRLGELKTEKKLQQTLQADPGQGATPEHQAEADEALAVYARAGRAAVTARLVATAQAAAGPRRLALAVALAAAADARAVALLLPLLADATPRVRQRAAGALGSLGPAGKSGTSALTRLLDDPDPSVALTASAALLALSPGPPGPAAAPPSPGTTPDGAYAHG